ncbi:MAG: hypothetical protein ACAH83_17380 [Alphaproteobacteria bacterium]
MAGRKGKADEPAGEDDPFQVAVFKNVRKIRLYNFKITQWKPEMQGTFRADFDGSACRHDFVFLFNAEGRLCAAPPMIPWRHTEILTLAEYPPEAQEALDQALRDLIPGIAPYGTDKKTGKKIWFKTPVRERMKDKTALDEILKRICAEDFEYMAAVR